MNRINLDRALSLLAAILVISGLAAAKLLDWIDLSWWIIVLIPLIVFALDAAGFLRAIERYRRRIFHPRDELP